ncbi:hypothetical protein [Flavobacterium sp. U410]|jgi:hypothetical protein
MLNTIFSKAKFDLVLNKPIKGTPVLENPNCSFSYNWDFDKNMGLARLESIENTGLNLTLHPLGIAGILAFMSDMSPLTVTIDGKEVVIFRVILDIDLVSGIKKAAIMFNQDGSTIQTTDNWENEHANLIS